MNPTKKSPGASRISSSTRKPVPAPQIKPVAGQLKTGLPAQSGKQPVAPPVYRPNTTTPNTAQPKMANATVNRKLPAAPPVYRPEAKKIVQPKIISQQGTLSSAPPVYRPAKIANSIQRITAKTTATRFSAVQMAQAEKIAHECSGTVVGNDDKRYEGEYAKDIHAEISALENYFSKGGDLGGIKSIEISSAPCKYCHIILSDLGIRDKVTLTRPDRRKFGRCQGGSYGWFTRGGALWKVIKAATRAKDEDTYADSVSERIKEL